MGLFLVEDGLLQRSFAAPSELFGPCDAGPAPVVEVTLPRLARHDVASVGLGISVVAVTLPGDGAAPRWRMLGEPRSRLGSKEGLFWGVVKIHSYNLRRSVNGSSNRRRRQTPPLGLTLNPIPFRRCAVPGGQGRLVDLPRHGTGQMRHHFDLLRPGLGT